MVAQEIRKALQDLVGEVSKEGSLLFDVPMNQCTTLRLGGPADMLWDATSAEALAAVLRLTQREGIPVTIIGNGSNLLVCDGGIRGLVIRIGTGMSRLSDPSPMPDGRFALTVEAGLTLARLSRAAAANGLGGLAFASGIPGSMGGAVYMNAGAYGGEIKDIVLSVSALDRAGNTLTWTNEEMAFGYRTSRLSQEKAGHVVTEVKIALSAGDQQAIEDEMQKLLAQRREKQPLSVPSCGSTFKRPTGHFAGTLIDQCGLKGARIGGASVSELHAGFLLNDQKGTTADYLALIAHVQHVVLEQTGVALTPEVRILGEELPLP